MITTGIDFGPEFDIRQVIRPDGITMQVMGSGQIEIIEDTGEQRVRINPIMFQNSVRAALCFPLSLQGRQIGVMWVHYDEPRHFPPFEIEALQLYVNQASIAYDSARRLEEVEHMRQAAEALAGVANASEVLNQIVQSAREVLGADSTAIWTYDDVRDKFILESSLADGIPETLWQEFRRQEPRRGQTAFTVMERGWVGINDIADREHYSYLGQSTRSLLGQIGVKSFQGIALTVGTENLGILYVNYNRSRSFSEEEQETARTFANHAALALKKARLLEQVDKVRNTARVVAKMATLKNLEDTLQAVVSGMHDALDCDAVILYVYDHGKERLRYPPTMKGVHFENKVYQLPGVAKDSIVITMLKRDDMYIVDNTANDPLFKDRRFTKDEGIVSCAIIPLSVSQGKVGVMFINYRTEHRFTNDEIINIELFAHQAAVAIHAAQLYEEVQARADALQALYEAGRIATSSLKLEEILSAIVEQAWRLTGINGPKAQFCTLALVEGSNLNPVATYPPDHLPEFQAIVGKRDLESETHIGVTGRAVTSGETQLIGDVTGDIDYIQYSRETQSELAVPLKIGNRVIGVINVENPERNAFDDKDKQALESLASQAAVAIRNAQSYREAIILQELSSSLVGTLELQEVLELVMAAAMALTNTESGSILFWDEQAKRFAPAFSTTGPERKLTLYTSTARKEGRAWNILHQKEPVIVPDTYHLPDTSEVALAKKRRALIGVPLLTGSKAIGVLFVNSTEPRHFSRHQMALLVTLANQTATAIDKARQYEELKQTKGLVGASTAVAWMGMVSSAWRHAIEGHAITIRDELDLLRNELEKTKQDKRTKARLKKIERQVQKILERPITPPLSEKEGVESIHVNTPA